MPQKKIMPEEIKMAFEENLVNDSPISEKFPVPCTECNDPLHITELLTGKHLLQLFHISIILVILFLNEKDYCGSLIQ